jgi:hypothetical protein
MTSWPNGAPRPGDRAALSRRVEAADIELFTRISGDRNPSAAMLARDRSRTGAAAMPSMGSAR